MNSFNNGIENYCGSENGNTRQKIYRVQGAIMFGVSLGLLVMRLIIGYLPIQNEALADFLFSFPLQVGVLVLMPFLVYKFVLKLKFKQIISFSNIKKTKWFNLVLAVPISLCFYCLTIGISGIWQSIIAALGYTHSSNVPLPTTFSPWLFILSMFLTGVLPGFCEEFCNRGGFLSTMRSRFSFGTTIVILGVAFGMFHQNITQVFYTMFFGAFAAFLTLKLKSVLPAMIMHFCNNAFSVFNEYAYEYGWVGGGFNALIDWCAQNSPFLIFGGFIVICGAGIALTYLLIKLNSHKKPVGGAQAITAPAPENLYKPTLKDNAFYIGAIVMAVLTTIFTFIFGFIV